MFSTMLRSLASPSFTLCGELNSVLSSTTRYQCVRWRRKPRWIPTAPSKLFRIPEKHRLPEEELKVLRKLHDNYRTSMRAIRAYFKEQTQAMTTGEEVIAEQKKLLEMEHAEAIQINKEWNARVAQAREQRIQVEKDAERERIIRYVAHLNYLEEKKKKDNEMLVKLEMERSKTFITPENIDAAIEDALTSHKDYNFAIDLEGNIYEGYRTKPNPPPLPVSTSPSEQTAVSNS